MGSNMAENHPVGFQWVIDAKEKGAQVIHVDPRFSRTSAVANIWVPLRAGSDIIFLGALVRYVLENELYFREYIVHYTNASAIIPEEFADTEDLGGVFSGWNEQEKSYHPKSWLYQGVDTDGDHAHKAGETAHRATQGGHSQQGANVSPDLSKFDKDPTLQHPR